MRQHQLLVLVAKGLKLYWMFMQLVCEVQSYLKPKKWVARLVVRKTPNSSLDILPSRFVSSRLIAAETSFSFKFIPCSLERATNSRESM
mmetsp:Transcript_10583/g.25864  ORF Transcript_10583/g.25864 Transcript_10583/m.25864 type:complete len:89 (+) Transcript_10583:185-451(+)